MLHITFLNKDMLTQIAGYLSVKDKHSHFGLVCKVFHQIAQGGLEADMKSFAKTKELVNLLKNDITDYKTASKVQAALLERGILIDPRICHSGCYPTTTHYTFDVDLNKIT